MNENLDDGPDTNGAELLPERIFATYHYPPEGRINLYSKPDYLIELVEVLKGTYEFNFIKNSSLGSLFQLHVRRCSFSSKLGHNFPSCSLHMSRRHEIWCTFGGKPFRFSLREFALVNGLPWGPYLDPETTRTLQKPGILLCNSQPVWASTQVVEMMKNLDTFLAYPWGRESFSLTLRMIKVGSKIGNVEDLVDKFIQSHTVIHGVPLSIQLFVLESIPLLQLYLPDMKGDKNLRDPSIGHLTLLKSYHNEDILTAEHHTSLIVILILQPDYPLDDALTSWPDEVEDASVEYLMRLISDGHNFTKEEWLGGHAGLLLMTPSDQVIKRLNAKVMASSKKPVNVKGKRRACPRI